MTSFINKYNANNPYYSTLQNTVSQSCGNIYNSPAQTNPNNVNTGNFEYKLNSLKSDTVSFGTKEIEADKKEKQTSLTRNQKILIGAGTVASTIIGGILLKGKFFKGNEFQKLAENINFEPAKTVKEAREFAKKQLGVKIFNIDNVDVANWVNEGLVNVNNKTKGSAKMPKTITMRDRIGGAEKFMASMSNEVPEYGHILTLNKKVFEEFDKNLKDVISGFTDAKILEKKKDGKWEINSFYKTEECQKLLDKYTKNKDLTFGEKVELYSNFSTISNINTAIVADPSSCLKGLFSNKKILEKIKESKLEHNGKPIDLEYILKQDKEEQQNIVQQLSGLLNVSFYRANSKFDTISHEMGHLQHQYSCKNYSNLSKPEKLANAGISLNKDVKEFIEDDKIQQTAAQVSEYAQTSPLEFVAETYKDLINNRKLSEDVMELYKKYNGPQF